ncbi:MAG: helix-turn-helix domain-containing protein [Pseudonocardiaceae bacterium]
MIAGCCAGCSPRPQCRCGPVTHCRSSRPSGSPRSTSRAATLRGLAELTGCSYSSIRRVLLWAGVTLRARGGTGSSWPGEAR